MASPDLSIIIPAFNVEPYLLTTVASISRQNYANFEVIIVDDGSTDGTRAVMESIGDQRCHRLYLDASGGPSAPRNAGIKSARGKWLLFFDADDIMAEDKLSRTVELFRARPAIGIVCTDFKRIDEKGVEFGETFLSECVGFSSLRRVSSSPEFEIIDREQFLRGMLLENFVGTSSVAVRREVIEDVGLFDEGLKSSEDRDMWLRIAGKYDLGVVRSVCHYYRVRRRSMMTLPASRLAPDRIRVLLRHLPRAKTRDERRAVRRQMGDNYFSLGYECQCAGRWGEAREMYRKSFVHKPRWRALRAVGVTFVGQAIGWTRVAPGGDEVVRNRSDRQSGDAD